MKKSRRFISLLLSIVMLFSITAGVDLSAYAYESEDFLYHLSGGNATITRYIGSADDLTIPSTIDGYSVTSIDDYAFRFSTSLTSVTIPDSVMSIGKYAFHSCTSLTRVTMENSVTNIGECAFYDCSSLTEITISDSIGSISSSLFEDCTSLTSVMIPDSVTSIGNFAFRNCSSLTSITIPNSVTSIGDWAFEFVNNIVYNGIASGSPWGAKSVNGYIDGYLVYKDSTKKDLLGCSAQATNVTIPNTVISIGNYAFSWCSGLANVIIPDSVKSIGEVAFYECTSITSVTIPNSVTIIGDWAFYECSNLTDVYYTGSEMQWNNISIGEENDNLINATIHYNYGKICNHNIIIDKAVEPTCSKTGKTEGKHCSLCSEVLVEQKIVTATGKHNYKPTTTKATLSKNGSVVKKCTACGSTQSSTTIYYPKTISLSATSYTYDGKVKTPSVKVVGSNGKAISSSNYTVSYASGRKNVGKYAVKITFKGNYSGSKTLYFTINPKGTSISSFSAGSKDFTVKWKKQTTQTTGYQIQYSTSSKFTNAKTVTVTKNSTTSKSITKLSGKKKYYVRIRTYKKVGSATYYSSWSKAKYVTTKK